MENPNPYILRRLVWITLDQGVSPVILYPVVHASIYVSRHVSHHVTLRLRLDALPARSVPAAALCNQ
jgi:hypothetical protein